MVLSRIKRLFSRKKGEIPDWEAAEFHTRGLPYQYGKPASPVTGLNCPLCGTKLERYTKYGRPYLWCPNCKRGFSYDEYYRLVEENIRRAAIEKQRQDMAEAYLAYYGEKGELAKEREKLYEEQFKGMKKTYGIGKGESRWKKLKSRVSETTSSSEFREKLPWAVLDVLLFIVLGALVARFGGIAPTPGQAWVFYVFGIITALMEFVSPSRLKVIQNAIGSRFRRDYSLEQTAGV